MNWCLASYLTLLVPVLLIVLASAFLASGTPLSASFACGIKFWAGASIVGAVLALIASFPLKGSGQALTLIAIHLVSLSLAWMLKFAASIPYAP